MANATVGVLGQANPAAGATADLFTPSSGTRKAVGSTIFVCNTGAAATTYRVYLRKAGAASGVGTAIAYDVAIPANTTDPWTVGPTIGPTDVLSVRSASGEVTFTLCGEESDVTT